MKTIEYRRVLLDKVPDFEEDGWQLVWRGAESVDLWCAGEVQSGLMFRECDE